MKHSYDSNCGCRRCTKERARRDMQSRQDAIGDAHRTAVHHLTRLRSRRPIPGSQEWAETRGDDIPSLD